MYFFRENAYSRINAVNYATRYALKPNPNFRYFPLDYTGGDCANFLSQCLHAGGAAMNSIWWYDNHGTPNVNDDTWSLQWTVAHSLYLHIKANQTYNRTGIKGLEVQDPRMLEIGDLIFFEDTDGNIFHSSIITSANDSRILISQHSYEALNIPYKESWPAEKWHFIKISL